MYYVDPSQGGRRHTQRVDFGKARFSISITTDLMLLLSKLGIRTLELHIKWWSDQKLYV